MNLRDRTLHPPESRFFILKAFICLLLSVFFVVDCGGGGGFRMGGSTAGGVTERPATGKIILPAGSKISLTGLTVLSGVDQEPLGAGGTFKVKLPGTGPGLVTLVNSAGSVVLMGYADPDASGSPFAGGNGEISVKQTAIALMFYGVNGYELPANLWEQLRNSIGASGQEATLATTLTTRLASDPNALNDGDAPTQSAVLAASASFEPAPRVQPKSATLLPKLPPGTNTISEAKVEVNATAGGTATLLLVQPSDEQSGVEVINDPNSATSIDFVNHLRRRCAAFIYETGVQQKGENLTDIAPVPLQTGQPSLLSALFTVVGSKAPTNGMVEVSPSNALHGVVGSIADVLSGIGAFTPTTTGPFQLSQDGTAIKTVYTIVVVGPAFQTGNDLSSFAPYTNSQFLDNRDDWTHALTALSWEEFLLDIAIPVVASIPFPDGLTVKGVDAGVLGEWGNALPPCPISTLRLPPVTSRMRSSRSCRRCWITELSVRN